MSTKCNCFETGHKLRRRLVFTRLSDLIVKKCYTNISNISISRPWWHDA